MNSSYLTQFGNPKTKKIEKARFHSYQGSIEHQSWAGQIVEDLDTTLL